MKCNTYHIKHYDKTTAIKIPKGVTFYLSMGHIWGSDEDRDTYNFISVIPYTEEMYNHIVHMDMSDNMNVHCYNILNKYIVWMLEDATPIEKDFPFTLEESVNDIEPIYIKQIEWDGKESYDLLHQRIMTLAASKDLKPGETYWPNADEYLEMERQCRMETSKVVGYMKINSLCHFHGVNVTAICRMLNGYSNSKGIIRQSVEYYHITNRDSNIIISEDEFNNALSEALQEMNVM